MFDSSERKAWRDWIIIEQKERISTDTRNWILYSLLEAMVQGFLRYMILWMVRIT